MTKNLSEELSWRGFTHQTTFGDPSTLNDKKLTFYWGVDPSSDSMTIGNLAIAMMVKHLIDHGHKAVLLVGGATGIIGDPDGKSKERKLLSPKDLERNKSAIAKQYKKIFEGQDFEIVDNQDWFKDINYIDFLRDVGKHVPMRQMLGREFVQSRLGDQGSGISYAEFSYSLIQGYDFLHLFREKDVTLQVCGSDQWGNSIAGVELIRRITGKEAHVWSAPLVVNKTTGAKFGKTEDGAVWLDADKTSVFDFYQFWLNVDDKNVEDYLKIYTLLSKEEIQKAIDEFKQNPGDRKAQKTLAYEVTKLIHGSVAAQSQKLIAEVLFGKEDALELGEREYTMLDKQLPTAKVPRNMTTEDIVGALVDTGLASSKTEGRRFLQNGAVYINNQKITENFLFDGVSKKAIIRRGKNNCAIINMV
ncbi:MAG TPA: tyrosine--tRNA ligase [Patescibacteria group bacterium]|nr:tyrosine--tRNA ligase [Patescibacteria group bacterium]